MKKIFVLYAPARRIQHGWGSLSRHCARCLRCCGGNPTPAPLLVTLVLLLWACARTAPAAESPSSTLSSTHTPTPADQRPRPAPTRNRSTPVRASAIPTSPRPTPSPTPIDPHMIYAKAHIPILCYHAIRAWLPSDTPDMQPYIVPPERFAEQLDFLVAHGYHAITPDQLLAFLLQDTPLPDHPILLTIDDGNDTDWTNALPELQRHQFLATFFPMTVVLDQPGYLTRGQVQALDRLGMTIGAHTWDHHRVDHYRDDDWKTQVAKPTQDFADLLGHPIRFFAYPYGQWDQAALGQLAHAGFVAAFQLEGPMDSEQPLFTLRRVIVNSYWDLSQFEQALHERF